MFSDTFDQNSLNVSKWTAEIRFSSEPDHEFLLYQSSPNELFIQDGLLHIRPTLFEDVFGEGSIWNETTLDLGGM